MRNTLLTAVLSCVMSLAGWNAAAADTRPNIVLILVDDMGAGDWEGGGSRFIRTPNLNQLAADGATLTRFYSSANVCTPARAALLTGRYAVRSGLARGVIFPHSTYGLPNEELTLAELLRAEGYSNKIIGKWHLGTTPEANPLEHGFDEYFGTPYSNDMAPFPLVRDRGIVEEEADQTQLTRKYTDAAADFIWRKAAEKKPFFLYFAHTFPHIPLHPSPAFRGRSKAGRYGDVIEEIDWSVGEVRAALKRAGVEDNTIVLFTSDNGPWFEGDSGVRGRKGDTHEGAFRVPMIAAYPGVIPAGSSSPALTMQTDLLPTLAGLAGADLPGDRVIDGRDILPVLKGSATSPHPYLVFFEEDRIAAIRTDRWRFVTLSFYRTLLANLERINSVLLFDLETHGEELFNVADDYPEVMAEFSSLLLNLRSELEGLPQKVTEPVIRSAR